MKVYVELAFREKRSVSSSFVLLDVVTVKESVFADFLFSLLGDFEHRIVLFSAKLVFDAVLSNVLFHNSYSFRITKFLVNTSIFGTLGICFGHLGTMPVSKSVMNTRTKIAAVMAALFFCVSPCCRLSNYNIPQKIP